MKSGIGMDLRQAVRGLARSPATTAAAVLCLGLGLGATTSIFTAVNAALLRPLPFPEPERLVSVFRTTPQFSGGPFSPANFLDLRRRTTSLEGLAAATPASALLQFDDRSVRVSANRASDDLFTMLGVPALHGRLFREGDEDLAQPLVAVLGEDFWREEFGGDPGVVGRMIRLDGRDHEVVGVLPRGARVPHGPRVLTSDVWVPLRFTPDRATQRRSNYLFLIGRLRPGTEVEAANARLRSVMAGIVERHPELRGEQLRVVSMHRESARAVREPLTLLLGAVGFVLLIAIANVASLLLARGAATRGEWAIRSALGAGRADVLRAALIQSGLLAAAGAALGLGLARTGVEIIGALVPSGLPQLADLRLDPRVLAFALAVAGISALIAGVAPAWQAHRTDPQDALRSDGRAGGSRVHHRFLRGLVVAEVAASLVLLLSAGLVLRGFGALVNQDPGFDPEPLLTLTVDVPPDNYPDGATVERFLRPALEAVRAQPGVERAAATSVIPYTRWGWNFNIRYEGRPEEDPTRRPLVETRVVTPGYFDALGMRLIRGRLLSPADDGSDDAPVVVVANRALAERDFPGEHAVGKRFHLSDTRFATIVGVVDDIKNVGPDRPPHPEVYWSAAQRGRGASSFPLVVRVAGEPMDFVRQVTAAIRSVEPMAAVSDVRPMERVIADSMGRPRFYLALLGVFAAVALILAVAGLYGVMSYVVEQRRREIGIRSALGSTPGATVRLILRQGSLLLAAGGVLGLVGGGAATRLLTGMLHGVSSLDAVTWLLTTLTLVIAGLLALVVPARRAATIDPLAAMRKE